MCDEDGGCGWVQAEIAERRIYRAMTRLGLTVAVRG